MGGREYLRHPLASIFVSFRYTCPSSRPYCLCCSSGCCPQRALHFPWHTLTLEPQSPGSLLSRVLKNCSSLGNISQALDTFANVAHPKRLHPFSLNLQIMILLFSLHLSTTESLPGESISKQTLRPHNHPLPSLQTHLS